MNLVQNYDGMPEFVRDRDFDMYLFLDRINVLSTEVYYDVLDTGGISTHVWDYVAVQYKQTLWTVSSMTKSSLWRTVFLNVYVE